MTMEVKRYLETNKELLEQNNFYELLLFAYNSLVLKNQKDLVETLRKASIDIDADLERVLYYIITRNFEDVQEPVYLRTFIDRYLLGILGSDFDYIFNLILDNEKDFEDQLEMQNGQYVVLPAEAL